MANKLLKAAEFITANILARLGGAAADPARIGSEHMPLIQLVDGVQLNDAVALVQDPYTLQRRGDDLTFADGLTNGGKSVHGFWMRGAKQQYTIPSTTNELRLAECVIPPNAIVADVSTSCMFRLRGSVAVRVSSGFYAPYLPLRVLFYLAGANEETSGTLRGTGVWLDLYWTGTGITILEIDEILSFNITALHASITDGVVASSVVRLKKLGVTASAPWVYPAKLTASGTVTNRRASYNPLPLTVRCAVLCPQAAASNFFNMTVLPTAGQTVVIGATTYTWRVAPAVANDVRIEATIPECLTSLGYAVTANGTYPTRFGAGTVANATVTCFMSGTYEKGYSTVYEVGMAFWAIATATTGASVVTTTTTTGATWVNGATMREPESTSVHIHGLCDVRLLPVTP